MRARAKVTSKGQITVPAEIREALGVGAGDFLAFETKEDYVTVAREPTPAEYFAELRRRHPSGPALMTDDEAITAYFQGLTEEEIHGGDTLFILSPGRPNPVKIFGVAKARR